MTKKNPKEVKIDVFGTDIPRPPGPLLGRRSRGGGGADVCFFKKNWSFEKCHIFLLPEDKREDSDSPTPHQR
jgi:hypothetical protein